MAESNAFTRRIILGFALAFPAFAARAAEPAETRLDALEKRSGARIGVAAIDMGGGNAVFYRETTRFLMCSSFKLMLAAAVLARADGERKISPASFPIPKPICWIIPPPPPAIWPRA